MGAEGASVKHANLSGKRTKIFCIFSAVIVFLRVVLSTRFFYA